MSAAAIPIPIHIKLVSKKSAHNTKIIKGNKNWVIAKITVLLLAFPPVIEVMNLKSNMYWTTPATIPINKPIMICGNIYPTPKILLPYSTPYMSKNQHN